MIELVEHTDAQERVYTEMYRAAVGWDGNDPLRHDGEERAVSSVETVRGPSTSTTSARRSCTSTSSCMDPEALQNYGHVWGESYWDEEVRVADAIAEAARAARGGIRTIVDPTAPGLGRYIPRIQRVNAEVDLNIVVASGVYAFLELPGFLAYRPTTRSRSCSCARSARASTTPASRRRS